MFAFWLSFRYLNLAQNKIEKLPTSADFEEDLSPKSKRRSRSSFVREKGYSTPLLEELYLQVDDHIFDFA